MQKGDYVHILQEKEQPLLKGTIKGFYDYSEQEKCLVPNNETFIFGLDESGFVSTCSGPEYVIIKTPDSKEKIEESSKILTRFEIQRFKQTTKKRMTEQTCPFRYKPSSPEERHEIKRRISTGHPRAGQRNLGSYLYEVERLGIDREHRKPPFFKRARFKSESGERTVLVSYPFFGLGFNLTVVDNQEAEFNAKQLDDFIRSGEYPSWYVEPKWRMEIHGPAQIS